ncbi:MAG: hypothetical protein IJI20_02510 [Firmicutes bacterium]|nr:hypothetical protein [Bacillota bacterium]
MMQTGTDPRLVKLRKYESILVISGFGVIAFGLWSIIRAAIYYFLNPLDVLDYIEEADLVEIMALGQEGGVEYITDNLDAIITGFIFLVLGIDLLLRVYVGLSARRDGRRRKKTVLYIIIAWFMAISMLGSVYSTVDDFFRPIIEAINSNPGEAYEETSASGDQAASVSIIVDITSMLVLVEVAFCGIMVRRLRKKLGIKTVRRKNKNEKTELSRELLEELNIPLERDEREALGKEFSDGLSTITGVRELSE